MKNKRNFKAQKQTGTFSMHSTVPSRSLTISRGIPFVDIKKRMVGDRYELSVVFVGDTRMRALNHTYRGKDSTTDILSFPLTKNSGEIIFSLARVKQKAKKFSLSPREYLTYLFIHGILHLKGLQHGRTMERLEDSWCRRFAVPAPRR